MKPVGNKKLMLIWCLLSSALLIISDPVFAQGAPITGTAQLDLGGVTNGELGMVSSVPVNVDLTGITAVDENTLTVPAALGNYRIAISYDNTLVKARVVAGAVPGGLTTEFSSAAIANIITNGTSDTLVITQTQLNTSSPTGLVNVAQIDFDVLTSVPTITPLSITVLDLRTPIIFTGLVAQPVIGGEEITSLVTNGSINIQMATDTDGDTLPDAWEILYGLNPNDPADALFDNDGDGLNNVAEYTNATDPNNPDSDGDLVPDGAEVSAGTNPNDAVDFPLWITSAPVVDGFELTPYQYLVIANNAGSTFSLDVAPAGMVIDTINGVIDWIPAAAQFGDFNVTVRVTNGADTATQSYVLSVAQAGDVNADGLVNAADLLLVQRHVLGQITLDAQQTMQADMYPPGGGDGLVTLSDLILLQRKVLGL